MQVNWLSVIRHPAGSLRKAIFPIALQGYRLLRLPLACDTQSCLLQLAAPMGSQLSYNFLRNGRFV